MPQGGRGHHPEMTPKAVAEKQNRVGAPRDQRADQPGISQAMKMMRARVVCAIGNKAMVVTGEEIDIPLHGAGESRIVSWLHAEIPQIKNVEMRVQMSREMGEPGRVILDRMGDDDGQSGFSFAEVSHRSRGLGRAWRRFRERSQPAEKRRLASS